MRLKKYAGIFRHMHNAYVCDSFYFQRFQKLNIFWRQIRYLCQSNNAFFNKSKLGPAFAPPGQYFGLVIFSSIQDLKWEILPYIPYFPSCSKHDINHHHRDIDKLLTLTLAQPSPKLTSPMRMCWPLLL